MHNYKELKIWQRSKDLSIRIYRLTSTFPEKEKFGLSNQMRRCSISVPSNIAEGSARNSNRQLEHFLNIALGSLAELDTQVIISQELKYTQSKELNLIIKEINELQKMITVFRNSLSN